MATEAQIKASVTHNKKMGSITIRPSKDIDAAIRQAAADANETLSEFILKSVQQRIDTTAGVVKNAEDAFANAKSGSSPISPESAELLDGLLSMIIRTAEQTQYDELEKELLSLVLKKLDSARKSEQVVPEENKSDCSIPSWLEFLIRESIRDAVRNYPEKKYDKLRYELDKLIFEAFSKEEIRLARRPCYCKSLL